MNNKLNTILPVSFGSIGGGYKGFTIGLVTTAGIIDCIIYAGVGAATGYALKLLFDYLRNKYHMRNKRNQRKNKVK